MSRTVIEPSAGDGVAGGDPVRASVEPPRRGGLRRLPLRQVLLVGSFFAMVIFFSAAEPGFLTGENLQNLVNDLPILGMLAISVTVVLVLGQFDLSVPNLAALTCVILALLAAQKGLDSGIALVLAVLLGLSASTLGGLVSGLAVGYGKASAFVVTLAVGSVAAGAELLVQGRIDLGQTQIARLDLPKPLLKLSDAHVLGFELSVVVLLVVALIVGLVLVHTPWGRHVQTIGGNETAARLAGVPVRRCKVIAFVVAGVLAGIAGVLFTARQGYFANAMPPFLLPAYAAAFFGAAAVGRRGFSIPATLFGALYLSTLSNGLTVMNEPLWVVSVVQGAVLFITVLIARAGSKSP
jgi:ribose transport system permease protein